MQPTFFLRSTEKKIVGPITAPRNKERTMKKLLLTIGLVVPGMAFGGDWTVYDDYGNYWYGNWDYGSGHGLSLR